MCQYIWSDQDDYLVLFRSSFWSLLLKKYLVEIYTMLVQVLCFLRGNIAKPTIFAVKLHCRTIEWGGGMNGLNGYIEARQPPDHQVTMNLPFPSKRWQLRKSLLTKMTWLARQTCTGTLFEDIHRSLLTKSSILTPLVLTIDTTCWSINPLFCGTTKFEVSFHPQKKKGGWTQLFRCKDKEARCCKRWVSTRLVGFPSVRPILAFSCFDDGDSESKIRDAICC